MIGCILLSHTYTGRGPNDYLGVEYFHPGATIRMRALDDYDPESIADRPLTLEVGYICSFSPLLLCKFSRSLPVCNF